jgi:transposase-like protein
MALSEEQLEACRERMLANRMSAPMKYDPEFAEIAKELCEGGATRADLADILGVHRTTITLWGNLYPDFAKAMRVGKGVADDRVKRSLYERATGYEYIDHEVVKLRNADGSERVEIVEVPRVMPPDVTAEIFWLKNRCPEEFRDKKDVGVTIEHVPSVDQARREIEDFMMKRIGSSSLAPPDEE